MKAIVHIVLVAVLTYAALYGAEAYGFSKGAASVKPVHPDFYSTTCFWLGQETTKLGNAPSDQILIASVKAHCIKP